MGGGTYEIPLMVEKLNDDLNKWDTLWKEANILRQFMENIRYYEMTHNKIIPFIIVYFRLQNDIVIL